MIFIKSSFVCIFKIVDTLILPQMDTLFMKTISTVRILLSCSTVWASYQE